MGTTFLNSTPDEFNQASIIMAPSTIPTSTSVVESAVIRAPLSHVWHYIKLQDFSKFWSAVSKSEFAKGASEETDIVKWTFKDGTVLEVITSQPELSYTSVVSTVRCYAVSSGALEGSTFVEWTGNFSSDADASVIQDAKFKRREALADLAKVAEKK